MLIEIKKLTKIYNDFLAVNEIDFQIEKYKTIGLLGPNGCGKTTTIGMMLGLVTPSKGEILIENKNKQRNFTNKETPNHFGHGIKKNTRLRKLILLFFIHQLSVRKYRQCRG